MAAIEDAIAASRPSEHPARPSRGMAIGAVVWISAVIVASIVWHPAAASPLGDYFTLCGFKNLTGLPCPGCGLTHSFCLLAKGDVTGAFAFNLLGPPTFVLLVLVWLRGFLVLANRFTPVSAFDGFVQRHRVLKRLVIAFAVFGLVRIGYILALRFDVVQGSMLGRLASKLFGWG